MPRLRAVQSNVHNHPSAVRKVLDLGGDSVTFNEAHRTLAVVGADRRYRLHSHGADVPDPRERATPIAVRSTRPNLGSVHLRISEKSRPERLAPARVASAVVYGHPFGVVGHIGVHLNAGVENAKPGTDRVREYRESVRSLERLVIFMKGEVEHLLVSGDVNVREDSERPFAPHEMLEALGLDVWSEGLDLLASTRGLGAPKREIVSREEIGTDHPTLVSTWAR